MTPQEVAQLRALWVGRGFWNWGLSECDLPVWFGEEVAVEDGSVILKFHAAESAELLGVRFGNEPLPVPALMSDELLDTAVDWYEDRRIALGVALDTGLLARTQRKAHSAWTELLVDPKAEGWEWELPPPRRSLFAAMRERLRR